MTASWRSRQELEQQAVLLATQGVGVRAITRALGVGRNTVRRLLARHRVARETVHSALPAPPKLAPRPKKIDPYVERVAELLARHPRITVQRVYEELRAAGFEGGYTAVKKHLRRVRPPPPPPPSLTTPVYGPGKMAESDWSPHTLALGPERELVQVHSYVLVHTPRKFYSVHEHCDLHALMAGHVAAFERNDGAAERCKYDSQKPVVLRWEGQQPIYNPAFLAFSAHYEFRPLAVRRGHPNDKPRTERSFWEFERSFLNGRTFHSREHLRVELARWLDDVVDQRRRKLSSPTPLERFLAQEKPYLVPLPCHPYDTARVVYRVASIDGFVAWQGNQYAVPYDHVTDLLPVRITEHELFVYAADLACVARHALAARGSGLRLDPAGLHPPPGRKGVPDLDQLRVAFARMGERSAAFFAALEVAQPRFCGHHARQILGLRERYDTADLDSALAHALAYGAFEHKAVERILAARATPRSLDEYVAEDTVRHLEQTLGACTIEPRDLDEYDRLPVAGTTPTTTPPVDGSTGRSHPPDGDTE